MATVSPKPSVHQIDDVGELLNQVVDAEVNSRQAQELIDEISLLLWAVSSLDPDTQNLLKHSSYVTDLVARRS